MGGPMGEWAWKEHLEKKEEEANEMDEIEKRLNAIYQGVDPKKVALLTSAKGSTAHTTGAPVGKLLQYQEAKRLTDGGAKPDVLTKALPAPAADVKVPRDVAGKPVIGGTNMTALD